MSSFESQILEPTHECPDKEDLAIGKQLGEIKARVALMPLGESHHRFVTSP